MASPPPARNSDEGRIEVAQAQTRPAPAPPAAAPPAAAPAAAPAPAPPPGRQQANIDRNNVLYLVRSTLMALHQANDTGNYSVLRELGAPGFQSVNNIARLSEIFANQRAQKLDLSAVTVFDPQITSAPSLDASGHLLIEGAYPQIPPGVAFQLLFAAVEGRWRLQGIGVNLAAPANAPAAAPPSAPAAQAPAAATPRPAATPPAGGRPGQPAQRPAGQ